MWRMFHSFSSFLIKKHAVVTDIAVKAVIVVVAIVAI